MAVRLLNALGLLGMAAAIGVLVVMALVIAGVIPRMTPAAPADGPKKE